MNTTKKDWNPRYVIYALAHGNTPDVMLAKDKERYKGGCMCGFILWVNRHVELFRASNPRCFVGPYIQDQDAFTDYLKTNGAPL